MSNKKVTVKRRNNNKNKKNNAGNVAAQLLRALKSTKSKNNKRSKPRNSNKNKDVGGLANTDRISAPSSFGSRTQMVKPKFLGGKTVIKHSEYIADISGSVAFTIQNSISCNPGLSASFPWLAQIAAAYEKFVVRNIEYRFETSSPSSIKGNLMLSPVYNEQDNAPTTKAAVMQNEGTTKCVPWMSLGCRIPAKYLKVYNEYYIRVGTIADVKTYDPFILYVCTQDNTDTSVLGELYVDYEIELINPVGTGAVVAATYEGGASLSSSGSLSHLDLTAGLLSSGYITIVAGTNANYFSMSPMVIGVEYLFALGIEGTLTDSTFAAISGCNLNNTTYTDNFNGTLVNFLTFTPTAVTAVIGVTCAATAVTQVAVAVAALGIDMPF
jgi:hypothetical protein